MSEQITSPKLSTKRLGRLRMMFAAVLLLGLFMVLCTPVATDYIRARHASRRVACAQDLRTIGIAYREYEKQFGRPPTNVQELVCAGPLAGKDLQAVHSVNAICFASSRPAPTDPCAVLAYEPLENHGTGAFVLYADGHVAWVNKLRYEKEIKPLQAATTAPSQ